MRQITIGAVATIGLVLVFSATACTPPYFMCGTEEVLEIQWDEEGPDGTVPEDAVEDFEGEYEASGLVLEDESELEFTIGLERREETVDYKVMGHDDPDASCSDAMVLPLTLTIHTSDGTFEDGFEVEAYNVPAGPNDEYFHVIHTFRLIDLNGTWQPSAPEARQVDDITVEITFHDDTVTGEIFLITESSDGDRPRQEREKAIVIGE